MNEFNTIEDVAIKVKGDLDHSSENKRISLLYAFNGTGKTRLSTLIGGESENNTLTYGVFFEDLFIWDNESYALKFNPHNRIIDFLKDQGLENQITDNFQELTKSKIHPSYDLEKGEITFNFAPGDDRSEDNIKISRGEESMFVWSIFRTILETVISALNTDPENRESEEFNDLEYIIIDDPVSSIDDTKIISIAIELIRVIDSYTGNKLKFLVTTHHALFYNVMFNEFKKKGYKRSSWLLSKNSINFTLEQQKDDSPFGYHLVVKDKIQDAINTNSLEKYHFNLFRGLLEKSANYLGYTHWSDCLRSDHKKEILKIVNHYSHGKLSDLESRHFPDEDKALLKNAFDDFIHRFQWKV